VSKRHKAWWSGRQVGSDLLAAARGGAALQAAERAKRSAANPCRWSYR